MKSRRRPRHAQLRAVVLLVVGAVLVIVSSSGRDTTPPRALPRQYAGVEASSPATASSATSAAAAAGVANGVADRVADGTSPPTRVQIAALTVDAPVVPVGSTGNEIEVPRRPAVLGWWTGGAAPGAQLGTAVLVGHVDNAASGPGALFHLDQIKAAQQIVVTAANGDSVGYRVTALRIVHKRRGLPPKLLTSAGPPTLVVITCGGPFDQRTRTYADNIVAIAARE